MTPGESDRTRWLVVWAVIAAGVVGAFQIGKAPVALPQLRAELGLGLVGAGWVVSMFNVLGALAGAVIGAASDQIGHRRAVLGGLVLGGGASLLGAAAPDAAMLLATRFVEGLGFMATATAGPALIVRTTRRVDQRLAFGFWSGYMPAGSALMMLASPPLLGTIGWRGLWLVNGAVMIAATLLVAAATRALPRPSVGAGRGIGAALTDVLRALRRPGPPTLALAFGCYTLQYLAVLAFLPTLLVEGDGMSEGAAAALTALANAANMLGTFGGGWLLHRGARRWAMIAAGSLVMALASVVIFAPGLPFAARYGAVIAFTALGGAVPPAVFGGAAVHAPSPALVGTTTGLIMQGSNLGQSIGPPLLAKLAAATGSWAWSPAVLLASALTGSALALVLRRLERRGG
ncbi:MAG TPA: MFS transporter [Stellaceae bacterium]